MFNEILITVVIIVLGIIVGKLLKDRKKKMIFREDDFTAAKHQFVKISNKGINYCNVCNELIAGFWSSNAQECIKCGMMVHQMCRFKRKEKCKKVTTDDPHFHHQWIEQVESSDICCVCQIKCLNFLEGNSSSCMWCKRAVHHSCKDNATKLCDCGTLGNIIIKPTEIKYHKKELTNYKYLKKTQQTKLTISQKLIQKFSKKNKIDSSEDTETDTEYLKHGEENWTLNLEEKKRPIIVVINKKSGGQLGMDYMKRLYRLLNPIQVIDLLEEGLGRLKIFKDVPGLQIVVGGGDGTVASVVNYIKSGDIERWKNKNPPVAVLPLGTGNDLGRCLGWGGGSEGASRVFDYLNQVQNQGQNILLDRWNLTCDKVCLYGQKEFKMYNYFSMGLDAKTCLNFHRLREKYPALFMSRVGNKFIYSQIGAADMFSGRKIDLSKMCEIIVDGKKVDIPNSIQNLVFLNITSWAGGATDLWRADPANTFKNQSIMDGTIEILGITSILHLGQVQTNLDKPIQIAQGSSIELKVLENDFSHAFQIDGEPFELKSPSTFKISLSDQVTMMTHKAQKALQWDAQVLEVLNWANQNNHINEQQKLILLNKFLNKN